MKQEEVVELVIKEYGNLDVFELEQTPDIQLIHKVSEELNTKNIKSSLVFYGLGRFQDTNLEEKSLPKKMVKTFIRK